MARPTKTNSEGNRVFVRYTAQFVSEDGEKWIHITDHDNGKDWQEPIDGWSYVLDLIRGESPLFRHKNGRRY